MRAAGRRPAGGRAAVARRQLLLDDDDLSRAARTRGRARRSDGRPARARKLADRIRQIVAETLEMRVKDPRLGFVTITDARITGDLREATRLLHRLRRRRPSAADTAAALASAKGVLRTEVGRQTGVRFTPTLAFVADALPETRAAHRGAARAGRGTPTPSWHQVRAGATYAGEPDPYRARARTTRTRPTVTDGVDATWTTRRERQSSDA